MTHPDMRLVPVDARDLDALRYVLNRADDFSRIRTVMSTFTLPERETTASRLERLYAALKSAAPHQPQPAAREEAPDVWNIIRRVAGLTVAGGDPAQDPAFSKYPAIADLVSKAQAALSAQQPARGEAVAWRETFIVDEEDGPAVGIVIDLPDGSQIWTSECSAQLLDEAAARDESPDESGQFLIVAARGEPTRVVAQVATVEDGIALARAVAGHTHPAPSQKPADDKLAKAVEALEPFAAFGRFEAEVAAQAPDANPAPDDSVFKHWSDAFGMAGPKLVYGDLRRAAEALAALKAEVK